MRRLGWVLGRCSLWLMDSPGLWVCPTLVMHYDLGPPLPMGQVGHVQRQAAGAVWGNQDYGRIFPGPVNLRVSVVEAYLTCMLCSISRNVSNDTDLQCSMGANPLHAHLMHILGKKQEGSRCKCCNSTFDL